MSLMGELVAWQKALDEMPRDAWMHARKDEDGRWQIIERGDAPPAWKQLSAGNLFFGIDIHNPIESGDRFAVGEEVWEAQPRGEGQPWTFVRADLR